MKNPDIVFEPWLLSLEERTEIFYKAKEKGKKVVVYYAKAPDSSTFRYRVYNTYQITKNSKKWQAIYFFKDEIATIRKILPTADLFVYSRQSRWDSLIEEIRKITKENKIPTLFDLDDLVFDKKYLDTVTNVIGEKNNLSHWIAYIDRIHETAKNSDGFLVTNDLLGQKISENFKKPYKVIRNSLNEEQIAAANAYLSLKKNQKGFSIGYFSGTATHVNDLAVALPEITEFLEKHTDATFKIVGFMDLGEKMSKFIKEKRITLLPPVDFRKLQRMMSEVDVNIAPLVNSIFTDCKSELKFFEAAIVKTATIASPTYTFARAIKDGQNGFLAQPGEWYDKIEYLYKNRKENANIAERARDYALKNYTGKVFLNEVETAYDYFTK